MNQSRKCTATEFALRCLLLLALWATGAMALAAPVAGTVVQLSGPLMAKKANGAIKVLVLKSEVENGDTLVTEKNTYAMVKFIDNSEITLRPDSTLTIENFSFDSGKQDDDRAHFNLVKGGLRSVTGLLGKRSKDKFELKTPAATIGIRGTTFIAQYVPPPPLTPGQPPSLPSPSSFPANQSAVAAPPLPGAPGIPSMPVLAPGLHVQVTDGAIIVNNNGGSLAFQAGQFGFVPNFKAPPIILPQNPGLQFTPPPIFNSSTGPGPAAGSDPSKSGAVDCIVR
ncbi:MAG TPA: FecR domain-containing protein [Pseudoduganella sp.]